MIGCCISDDKKVKEAAKNEIIRRYLNAIVDVKMGKCDIEVAKRIKVLMNELKIDESNRKVIKACHLKSIKEKKEVIALKLPNGKIITGKQTDILSPASSLFLNAIKELTGIPDDVYLLSPLVLNPILDLKKKLGNNKVLHLDEVMLSLSVCSVTNPIINSALDNMSKLNNLEAHSSYILSNEELKILKNLKINITCDAVFKQL